MKKNTIAVYQDAVVGRLKNRKMVLSPAQDGNNSAFLQFVVASNNPFPITWEEDIRGNVSRAVIKLSEEGRQMLMEMLIAYDHPNKIKSV